jgi:hypothetical protein
LSDFAAIDALFARRHNRQWAAGETSDCNDNIENYIVNNFQARYDCLTNNKADGTAGSPSGRTA